MDLISFRDSLQKSASPKAAASSLRFFKASSVKDDLFIGVTNPLLRKITKNFVHLSLLDLQDLLTSKVHEERLGALFILIEKFKKGSVAEKKELYEFYLAHTAYINNWDLVDASAPYLVGAFLFDKPRAILDVWAKSPDIWVRRIAIVCTLYFIRKGEYEDTLRIAETLLKDLEDLIHKASGWMLREVGKKSLPHLESFLNRFCTTMPRTMLRYSLERFPEPLRKSYLFQKGAADLLLKRLP